MSQYCAAAVVAARSKGGLSLGKMAHFTGRA